MDQADALALIDQLGGDEQPWLDYKEDYYIQGNPYEKAEFRKDVQALVNADTDQDPRYILIGCDEDDGVVGVSSDATDDDVNRRHILSFEADDIQEKLDNSLRPSPQIRLYTFEEDGDIFAVLAVEAVDRVPSVSTSKFASDGNTFLREGDIWIRKSSGKKRADSEDIENLIRRRITQRRDFIHEGIRRVVEMDPDTIADIGSLEPNEAGQADITFEIDEEGDYSVSGEMFRREFSGIEEEFDADVGKRRRNDQYFIDLQSLMRYYVELPVPSEQEDARLLVESAMRNWLPGVYWLQKIPQDERMDILRNVPDQNAVRHVACKTLVVAGDQETFERYLDDSEAIQHPRFNAASYRRSFEDAAEDRVSRVESSTKDIDLGGETINAAEVDQDLDVINGYVPAVAEAWLGADTNDGRKNAKYSLVNLELKIVAEIL